MAVWKNTKPKIFTSRYSPRNITKPQVDAFNFFKENGEDYYINHCTQRKELKEPVKYLVYQNVVFVVGDGPEKKIIWNPLLPRKGRRYDIINKARVYKRSEINARVKKEEEQKRAKNTISLSQKGSRIQIKPSDENSLLPYCDIKGTHLEQLTRGGSSKGIGYVKDGYLVAFNFDGEFDGGKPEYDDSRKILITADKIYFT
jgi:hypothetical protein